MKNNQATITDTKTAEAMARYEQKKQELARLTFKKIAAGHYVATTPEGWEISLINSTLSNYWFTMIRGTDIIWTGVHSETKAGIERIARQMYNAMGQA